MFGRQWTNEAKIAIFNDPTLIWRLASPANPREYLHKHYTARNYVPWATFLSLTVYGYSSANVRTVLFESRTAEPETDFNVKWIFRVIQGHLFRYHWRATKRYILCYNTRDLRCECSEDIASERSKNRHLRPPRSHLTLPLQRTPANICIKLTLLETRIPIFLALIVWVYLHSNVSGWLWKTCVMQQSA